MLASSAGTVRPRGRFLLALGAMLVGTVGVAVIAACTQGGEAHPYTPPWKTAPTGEVREFHLTIARGEWSLAPGRTVTAHTINGQTPGPELRVKEGDLVRVVVRNDLQEPTTLHWHGVAVPVAMDGVPDLSQRPIPAGGTFTYQFVATPSGTRWYHTHFNEIVQQGLGLVAPLIVESRQPEGKPPGREYTLVTQDWGPPGRPVAGGQGMRGAGGMAEMMMSGSQRVVDVYSVNGRAYPASRPLVVRQGERVRLRLVNAGLTETQVIGIAGHRLTLVASDGNRLARPVDGDSVQLGVGERADVEFTADRPGRWLLRGLGKDQASKGLAAEIVYAGHENEAIQDLAQDSGLRQITYADMQGPRRPSGVDRDYSLSLSGGMMAPDQWTINGKRYPSTDPIDVKPGQRVRLRLSNMSMQDHPMHLHGHSFQLVAISGRQVDGPIKDTVTVRPMERYDIEFTADNPGTWLFHCHNIGHMSGGLMAEVHYRT